MLPPEVLRYLDQQWSFMVGNDCVPVKVALQFMDQSSIGLADQYDQFQEIHAQLQSALKTIVNEHHQGFNSSIGTFHQIQASIQASQQRVRDLRLSLVEAKGVLSTVRPELKAFATTSHEYDQMLITITHIQELQEMPEKIEAQITEKRFLGAVRTLQDALKLIRKPELAELGALSDLQLYLNNQEASLSDILVEELHNHLYLKSPYCEDRWRRYATRSIAGERSAMPAERHQLTQFLDNTDFVTPMLEDVFHNPEVNTFAYLRLLLESLDRMSRLDFAIEAIHQRMPLEIFRLVDKCYSEVESRHPATARDRGGVSAHRHAKHDADARASDYQRADIIEDTLSTLYARLEATAESQRVLHEVIVAINRRQGSQKAAAAGLRCFAELWEVYQSEIRALLHDHLTSEGEFQNRLRRENDVNAHMFTAHSRDKTKKLFKLSLTDTNSSTLASEKEDLDFIFKASVPGLVSSAANTTTFMTDSTDRHAERTGNTIHKILVEPSVFNMNSLLPMSFAFLTRLKDLVPPSSDVVVSTLTTFLDDFLVNVFLPQMEDSLVDQCSIALSSADAFHEDGTWQQHASRPVSKGTIKYVEILEQFCRILGSLPADQSFAMLIINQIRNFYRRCREVYDILMSKPELEAGTGRKFRRSAQLAESGEFRQLLKDMFDNGREGDPAYEIELLLRGSKTRPIVKSDLLPDPKAVGRLGTLYTSVRWFAAKISALRHVEHEATVDRSTSLVVRARERWAVGTGSRIDSPAFLPLDEHTATEFDGLTTFLGELASLILRTMYLELRTQSLFSLSRAMSTSYRLSQPYSDPDQSILELNQTVLSFDGELAARLPRHAYGLCIANLASSVDIALLALASEIPDMDSFGHVRMFLNVSVLQQNLREIDDNANLDQATRLWKLWDDGPEMMVEAVKEGLDRNAVKSLLELYFGHGNDKLTEGKLQLEHYLSRIDAV